MLIYLLFFFFFFNDTATTEIYTLSLHDALPICLDVREILLVRPARIAAQIVHRQADKVDVVISGPVDRVPVQDRKSTRLNSSHTVISYAVFCLKKKKTFPYEPDASRQTITELLV